ncbi:MAG: type II toxin-antitoxin system Phd/YefM family antitoxin [Rhodocyclaceae bacterium]|nr:type II toxin-antitoxin system Phd/YefM family antitoxin [Rhodocyclaceae bacterium]
MEQVNIYQAKTHFSKYIEAVEAGKEVIIARGGKQVAKLTSIKPLKRPIRFGVLKGSVSVAADFDAPLADEIVAGFEGR